MESKMKAKNELNGTDKDVSDGQDAVNRVVSGSASKRKGIGLALEIVLWVLAIFCLPMVNIILWAFRLCNLKRKHPERERVYMWVIFPFMVAVSIPWLLLFLFLLFDDGNYGIGLPYQDDVYYTGEAVDATKYGTVEALYELTGVQFPEITPVDSSLYEAFGTDYLRSMYHVYVLPEDVDESFYKSLGKACVSDSAHWKVIDSYGNGYVYFEDIFIEESSFQSEYHFISVSIAGDTVRVHEYRDKENYGISDLPLRFYDGW